MIRDVIGDYELPRCNLHVGGNFNGLAVPPRVSPAHDMMHCGIEDKSHGIDYAWKKCIINNFNPPLLTINKSRSE